MNPKKLLTPFKRRLLTEQVAHALLCGISAASVVIFVFSLVSHICVYSPPVYLYIIIGLSILLPTFVICILTVDRPSTEKTARRVDDTGLQDRVSTMLEYSDNPSEIAAIQRADALNSLKSVTPKALPLRFSRALLITAVSSSVLMICMLVLPTDIFVKATETKDTANETSQIIKDLLADLREQAKDLKDSDEITDAINEIIDNLERDLSKGELSDEEKASKIDSAEIQIENILDKAVTKYAIGEALQRYELTQKLGEAISSGDTEGVKDALAELFDITAADTGKMLTLKENIESALTLSGVDSSDQLYTALNTFASALGSLYVESFEYTTARDAGIEEDLSKSFNRAEEDIIAALEKQASWEETAGKLEDILNNAKDDILGIEKPEDVEKPEGDQQDGEKPEGSPEDGEKPEGAPENMEKPDGFPEGEEPPEDAPNMDFGEDDSYSATSTMTEIIYDPILGDVTYGDVYSSYYMDYLNRLNNGEVPESMEDKLSNYYEKLGNGDNQ